MDKIDKKILSALLENARLPLKQIAKKANVSKEVASYRIKQLIKKRIIKEFITLINTEALGFSRYACFFQLNTTEEKEFLEYLKDHEFITYVGITVGKWNVVFDILAKSREHCNEIIKDILSFVEDNLESYIVIPAAYEQEVYPAKLIGLKKINTVRPKINKQCDDLDFKILSMLTQNARIEYATLAKKIHLSGNAIKQRIKALQGIIQGYTISINWRALNLEWYNVQIKIKKETALKEFLREHAKVLYFYHYLGHSWDMDIGVIAEDSLAFRSFLLELRKQSITIQDIYLIAEEIKGNYAPSGVFK
ncbi:Lrp/AsnC family transcriptional regulator [Candidatus Woesearchaeota archaeon]|nr:MAG: Lrp/AsnC family transcriptional regulator [Candidatus Woesearchaeota archaeon]